MCSAHPDWFQRPANRTAFERLFAKCAGSCSREVGSHRVYGIGRRRIHGASSDNLIYFNYQQPGVTQDSDIWKVEKKDGVWQKPESLGPRINSPYRDHMHWTGLSKDGKSLIVTSTRTDMGSRGGHDMWISYQNPKGEWQEPLNLGDTINTAGEDMCWTFTPMAKHCRQPWTIRFIQSRYYVGSQRPGSVAEKLRADRPPPNLLKSAGEKQRTPDFVNGSCDGAK